MDATIDSNIKMFQVVDELYTLFQPRFDVVPIFPVKFGVFKANLTQIDTYMLTSLQTSVGTTESKDLTQQALAEATVAVAIPTSACAASIPDPELVKAMNVTVPYLMSLIKDHVGPKCRNIYNRAKAVEAEALPYNVTKTKLDALELALTNWDNKKTATAIITGDINSSKDLIAALVDTNNALLKDVLDKLVLSLGDTDADLVSKWDRARTVKKLPSTPTALKINITEAVTAVKLENAIITLVGGTTTLPNLSGTTDGLGELVFKPIKYGTYAEVKVALEGYQTIVIKKYKVVKGKINHIKEELTPLPVPDGL